MALINLRLIGKIALECFHFKTLVETSSFDTTRWTDLRMTDQHYVTLYCRWLQADNLHKQLEQLRDIAKDFAAGNIQKELDSWLEFYGEDGEPFDPFGTLEYKFNCETVYDLPERIEQYAELVPFVMDFARRTQAKNQAFDKFFGGVAKYYQATDEEGEAVMIPESDLSPEMQEQVRLGQIMGEIEDVDAEYALVNYDEFYATCRKLFDTYRPTGDYQACAAGILSLFA